MGAYVTFAGLCPDVATMMKTMSYSKPQKVGAVNGLPESKGGPACCGMTNDARQ
jgi:hypothetical protein